MSKRSPSVESLKQTVFTRLEQCRKDIATGVADMTGMEEDVRSYCDAVAALPREQGQAHAEDMVKLLDEMNQLRAELVASHTAIQSELEALGRVKKAHTAYQKTGAIGGKKGTKES